jgi:hypothetical protein
VSADERAAAEAAVRSAKEKVNDAWYALGAASRALIAAGEQTTGHRLADDRHALGEIAEDLTTLLDAFDALAGRTAAWEPR